MVVARCFLSGMVVACCVAGLFGAGPPTPSFVEPSFRRVLVIPKAHVNTTNDIAVSPDGKLIASTGDMKLKLWDARNGRLLAERGWQHVAGISIGFVRGGDIACAFNGHRPACLLRVPSLKQRSELHSFPMPNYDSLDVSRDGKEVAASEIFRLSAWSAATRKVVFQRAFEVDTTRISRAVLSPDGNTVAASFSSYTSESAPMVPPAGTDVVRLYDVRTGKELRRISRPGANSHFAPRDLAFSPDGRLLVAGMHDENVVCVWDVRTGKPAMTFTWVAQLRPKPWQPSPTPGIYSLAFSPDGKTLAVMCSDLRLRLVEVLTGTIRAERQIHARKVIFSPGGRRLVALGYNHPRTDIEVLDWRAPRESPAGRLSGRTLERLWLELEKADAAVGHRAIVALAAAPDQAVELLGRRLRPVEAVDKPTLSRLTAGLDDEDFDVRQRASAELRRLGHQAEAALRAALADRPSPELRGRVLALLKDLEKGGARRRRYFRAVEALELIGTPAAFRVLEKLAQGDPKARETTDTVEARQRSLARLRSGAK